MTKDQALKSIERLDKLIGSFGGPYNDEHTEFKAIVSSLRNGPLRDAYFREKLFDLESQASDGFSVRKFANRTGELQKVKAWAIGSLDTARNLIEQHWPE